MDLKKEQLKSDCLRRTVSPRFGLRLLRDSVRQDEALRVWRSNAVKSTIRKYLHREKKRARLSKRAQNTNQTERTEETYRVWAETGSAASSHLPPPGAMAPHNTTQYLLGQLYEDLQQKADVWSFSAPLRPSEELGSPLNSRAALDSFDACLSFQLRDFEEQFGSLW